MVETHYCHSTKLIITEVEGDVPQDKCVGSSKTTQLYIRCMQIVRAHYEVGGWGGWGTGVA